MITLPPSILAHNTPPASFSINKKSPQKHRSNLSLTNAPTLTVADNHIKWSSAACNHPSCGAYHRPTNPPLSRPFTAANLPSSEPQIAASTPTMCVPTDEERQLKTSEDCVDCIQLRRCLNCHRESFKHHTMVLYSDEWFCSHS